MDQVFNRMRSTLDQKWAGMLDDWESIDETKRVLLCATAAHVRNDPTLITALDDMVIGKFCDLALMAMSELEVRLRERHDEIAAAGE